jgi:cytochrome b involved in lipid metabolism
MKAYNITYIVLLLIVLVFAGCRDNTAQEVEGQDLRDKGVNNEDAKEIDGFGPGSEIEDISNRNTYTSEQVLMHNQPDDCWMIITGKVYDVSEFVNVHPGGRNLLQGCGIDATELFETRPMGSGTAHSGRARTMLDNYYIGELEE